MDKDYNNGILHAVVNKQNVIKLLVVYNLTYLLFCVLFTDDSRFAFMTAALIALATLIGLAVAKTVEDFYGKEKEHHQLEDTMLQTIRREYQKTHMMKVKQEFLVKTHLMDDEGNMTDFEESITEIKTEEEPDISGRVHLDYLNRYGTQGLHDVENGGQH